MTAQRLSDTRVKTAGDTWLRRRNMPRDSR